jgi:NAD/NADP transhydrogenase alpha subunit
MATSALLIALAGGAGAAVGGAIAQTAGFFVERYKVRVAAEQRKQDLRVALRREQRELAEARARERRDRQAQTYDEVAFELEEIIQASDWFDFMLSRRTEEELATEKMREVL